MFYMKLALLFTEIIGILMLITAIRSLYRINSGKFYRRNTAKIESFESYERTIGSRFMNAVLIIVSLFLALVGVFFIAAGVSAIQTLFVFF